MKTKRLLLALSLLVLLAGVGYAQPTTPAHGGVAQQEQHHTEQQNREAFAKGMLRWFWDGQGTGILAYQVLRCPELREAVGISEEQYQQFNDAYLNAMLPPEDPEIAVLREEMSELFAENLERHRTDVQLDEDIIQRIADVDAEIRKRQAIVVLDLDKINNVIIENMGNVLTTKQVQKIQETLLAAMGEFPFVSPYMFDALNLTDAQRQEMERIKKELEPEFEKHLDVYARNVAILEGKLEAEMVKNVRDSEGNPESREDATKRLLAENREFRRISDETQSQSTAFSTQFRTRMFDVLTDEQWRRLQDLIDNPPPHAQILIAKLREQRGETEENKSDVWVPGPNSWRPGDPLPESYRIQRNTRVRFPRPQ